MSTQLSVSVSVSVSVTCSSTGLRHCSNRNLSWKQEFNWFIESLQL